jgi:transcriptional regulator
MYIPSSFTATDTQANSLIDAHPLATLVCTDASGSEVNLLPLLRADDGTLLGHIARANPLWQRCTDGHPAVAIFNGPHGYVHPGWYPSKAEGGKVVPTWNYQSVVVHGRLFWQHDADTLRQRIEMLTQRMEGVRAQPWTVDEAPADYTAALMRAIVALRFEVDRIDAKFKLSQNHPTANREGVIAGLSDPNDPHAQAALAAAMREAMG